MGKKKQEKGQIGREKEKTKPLKNINGVFFHFLYYRPASITAMMQNVITSALGHFKVF